ncbi:hypothetical protein GE118_01975 [Mycoplasma sp. NEAQ87857]|uniref:MAG3720 family protein n=1 Tax=Mycoplasma sp. NEAQ87857 TaxID=2683967 RepID=UPI0013165C10|nr:hypothetical protein [Mycoplasma sp. NEAQ87857]QGZ97562.1 hypothetical protein GE118_01975 [Mycoplasma sp. NEAQ87857]
MLKYYANFYISSKTISFSLIKDVDGILVSAGNNCNFEFDYRSKSESKIKALQLKDIFSNLDNNSIIASNIIFEDSLFQDIKFNKLEINLEKSEIQNSDLTLKDLKNLINDKTKKHLEELIDHQTNIVINQPYKFVVHYQGISKEYTKLNQNIEWDLITQYSSFIAINKNELAFNKITQFLDNIGLTKKRNYWLKSQVIASEFISNKRINILVNLSSDFCSFNIVQNGVIIGYKKLLVGTSSLIKQLTLETKLNQSQILNRLRYVAKNAYSYQDNSLALDNNLKYFASQMERFNNNIAKEIHNFVSIYVLNNMYNGFDKLSFSGELDWFINHLMQLFKKVNKAKIEPVFINQTNQRYIFGSDANKVIKQALTLTSWFNNNKPIQPGTSDVNLKEFDNTNSNLKKIFNKWKGVN